MAIEHGRQVAPEVSGIRDDHVVRYRFAVEQILKRYPRPDDLSVIDVGCGCGYGASILAHGIAGTIFATDSDGEAITYARKYYSHPNIRWSCVDWNLLHPHMARATVMTAFEVLEHLPSADAFLRQASTKIGLLVGSVPNEAVTPYDVNKHKYHHRHYTCESLHNTLCSTGWQPVSIGGQMGKRGPTAEVRPDPRACRTLVFVAIPE